MSKVCRESFLKWLWVLAEASPLGESFTSQICKLFAWHFGEEGKRCAPESMVKSRAAKEAEKRKKDLETSLSWLENGVSDFTGQADYLKMIPVSSEVITAPLLHGCNGLGVVAGSCECQECVFLHGL